MGFYRTLQILISSILTRWFLKPAHRNGWPTEHAEYSARDFKSPHRHVKAKRSSTTQHQAHQNASVFKPGSSCFAGSAGWTPLIAAKQGSTTGGIGWLVPRSHAPFNVIPILFKIHGAKGPLLQTEQAHWWGFRPRSSNLRHIGRLYRPPRSFQSPPFLNFIRIGLFEEWWPILLQDPQNGVDHLLSTGSDVLKRKPLVDCMSTLEDCPLVRVYSHRRKW